MPLHLHIFEERYKLMMKHCLEGPRYFGVTLILTGAEAFGPAETYSVGTLARVLEVEPLEDGRMNLSVVGEERFRILERLQDQPYPRGNVEGLPMRTSRLLEALRGMAFLRQDASRYLKKAYPHEVAGASRFEWPSDPLVLLALAATLLDLPLHEKQALLELDEAGDLFHEVSRLYRRELALLEKLPKTHTSDRMPDQFLN